MISRRGWAMNTRKTNKSFLSLTVILACFILFFLTFFSELAFGGMAEELMTQDQFRKISLDLDGATLISVLKVFSQQSGLNFIAEQAIAYKPVTLYLENVPIQDALDKILKTYNLTYELDEDSSIFIVKALTEEKEDKTITRAVSYTHLTLPTIYSV